MKEIYNGFVTLVGVTAALFTVFVVVPGLLTMVFGFSTVIGLFALLLTYLWFWAGWACRNEQTPWFLPNFNWRTWHLTTAVRRRRERKIHREQFRIMQERDRARAAWRTEADLRR